MRCGRRQRAIMPGGDVQRVGAGLAPPRSRPAGLPRTAARREKVVDRDPVDHAECRHRGLHRAQHVEAEAGAVLQGAAVVVGAPVLERRVRIARSDSRARRGSRRSRSRPARRARRRRRRRRWSARCRSARHLLRHDGLVGDLEHRMRDRRRRDRRLAADVDAGVAAAVAELDRGLGAAAMDFARRAASGRAGSGRRRCRARAGGGGRPCSGDAISTVIRPTPPRTRAM